MKRVTLRVAACLLLGLMTTAAVAWSCALWPRGQEWTGTIRGVTSHAQPGWMLKGYSGPGFHWVEGWPILDYSHFLGPRLLKEFAEYPMLEPQVIGSAEWAANLYEPPAIDGSERWLSTFQRPPTEASRYELTVVEVVGWPLPALRRVFHINLAAEIDRLKGKVIYQNAYGGREWPTSEYDWLTDHGSPHSELLAGAGLPVAPLWSGMLFNTLIFSGAWLATYLWWRLMWLVLVTMSVRTRVSIIMSCLLIGLLTTIAVAWACAAWVDPVDPDQYPPAISGGSFGGFSDPGKNHQLWEVYIERCAGAMHIRSAWLDPDIRMGFSGMFPGGPAEPLVPWWAGFLKPLDPPTTQQQHERIVEAWGWPLLAMWCRRSADAPHLQQRVAPTLSHGIALPPVSRTRMFFGTRVVERALPLAAIWPAFAIDTILFGATSLTLIVLAIFSRCGRGWWRLRRGRCPVCAYPIGVSEVCTECGKRLPQASAGR